jgi:hypothetical protein
VPLDVGDHEGAGARIANAPSLRVAAKCGYRELARTTYKGEPTVVLER